MSEAVSAPFPDDQVASLNGCQAAGCSHPFTCGTDGCRAALRAERDGASEFFTTSMRQRTKCRSWPSA